jgi:K+-sensing histidine kinase KdpD
MLAERLGAGIVFVAVAREASRSAELEEYARVEGIGSVSVPIMSWSAKSCLAVAEQLAVNAGLANTRSIVRVGVADKVLSSVAKQEDVDVIVVGNNEIRFLRNLFRKPLFAGLISTAGEVDVIVVR